MLMIGGMEVGMGVGEVVGGKDVWRRWRRVWRVVAVWIFVFFRMEGGGGKGEKRGGRGWGRDWEGVGDGSKRRIEFGGSSSFSTMNIDIEFDHLF